ncbi:MAG: phosphoenolpyruvate carboxylase [Pseudomonadota bacterium]
MADTQKQINQLTERLKELRTELERDPLANPVRRLSHELSQEIESGRLSLDQTEAMISVLSADAALARQKRGEAYLENAGTLSEAVRLLIGDAATADEIAERTARPVETVVFTGHPTFSMGPEGGGALRGGVPIERATETRAQISLDDEHCEAVRALRSAAQAVVQTSAATLHAAREQIGDGFRELLPCPIGLATWVGYDLDGRQDISWTRIFRHRLIEKASALGDYCERLQQFSAVPGVAPVLEAIDKAYRAAQVHSERFSDDEALRTPTGVAGAANALTADGEGRLTSLRSIIADLRAAAQGAEPDDAIGLLSIAALMQTRGLGLAEVHFRLNASQIRNAARSLLPIDHDADLFGHSVLTAINQAAAEVKPQRVNFASLDEETSSARRIVIAAAQIQKHIDEDTPIRLLIAECENPVTVLTAVYLARRYGISHTLDICPLFETADSFDRSGRILNVLLKQPAYRAQVEQRGRVPIEAGFSDAGRFMGQLPATMAIERLQSQLAREMQRQGLEKLEAVIFNTHGESMGRGGHPSSILDRSCYAMSPWARGRFRESDIRLNHEISFQGGDGYAWFASPESAEAVLAGLLKARYTDEQESDPFYRRTEASLDFYNSVQREQMVLFGEEAMAMVAMGPGLALLPVAGSRKTKRQFERSSEEELSLRSIRAISHNGSLQQIGYVANIHAGVGEAIGRETEAYTELYQASDRFRRLMSLAARAVQLSDMKTLIAYMKLYDGSFWATRPSAGGEPYLERPCGDLAAHLVKDRRYFAALELAARLRPGAIKLQRGLEAMGFEALGRSPLNLDLLHALRLALIQHMFLLGARLPTFARAGGFSRDEVLNEILALDVPRAVDQLRIGFPQRQSSEVRKLFDEPADDDGSDAGYEAIERETIAPLERAFGQCRRISLAVSHHFGAHG